MHARVSPPSIEGLGEVVTSTPKAGGTYTPRRDARPMHVPESKTAHHEAHGIYAHDVTGISDSYAAANRTKLQNS